MYAIIETGGKQYRVREGDVLNIEKLTAEEGALVELDQVLAISREDAIRLGEPVLAGAKVVAKVLAHGRAKKILIFKYKPKKNYRRKQGHRQSYTTIQVEKIEG